MSGAKFALCNFDILNNSAVVECIACDRPIHRGCVNPLQVDKFYCSACHIRDSSTENSSSISSNTYSTATDTALKSLVNQSVWPFEYSAKRLASALSPPSEPVAKLSRTSESTISSQKSIMNNESTETPPPWFANFVKSQDDKFEKLSNGINDVRQLITTSNQVIFNQLAVTNIKVNSLLNLLTTEDTYEIKISPIPAELYEKGHNGNSIAEAIFKALDLVNLKHQIANIRYWNNKKGNVANPQYTNGTSDIVVVQFYSKIARDQVLSKSSHLKDVNCETIFGAGGQAKIYISSIYPGAVYKLLRNAQKVASLINFIRPLVRNSKVVCMRKDRSSPLIPILHESDLTELMNSVKGNVSAADVTMGQTSSPTTL